MMPSVRIGKRQQQKRTKILYRVAWWSGMAGWKLSLIVWLALLIVVLIYEFLRGFCFGCVEQWRDIWAKEPP